MSDLFTRDAAGDERERDCRIEDDILQGEGADHQGSNILVVEVEKRTFEKPKDDSLRKEYRGVIEYLDKIDEL